ncbi:(d)CMP kinase [Mumia zhuanghuii]|uniref:Cytidylate kinase n=1 Tax=Mumia zhuanghuii TaxID=2585211 RepID=A0A5C4MC42_9ACTN|nr:(d)CMP kinase [Mumia zhuanghuii]TNC31304.1 (d)CMP kinase [Mumia zhuanghuii]
MPPAVIALDGPSGSGKSSTARGVATRLGLAYLDTGAMYRAMTWAVLERGVDVEDAAAVAAAAADVVIVSGTDPQAPTIEADGVDVSGPIRSQRVTDAVSQVSRVPEVRQRLVDLQRDIIAASDGIVLEGRDIGTVVAPDAPLKLYLVADTAARAARRAAEEGRSEAAHVEATAASLQRRDAIDSSRTASPLAKAADALELDTTHLTLDEVVDEVVRLAAKAVPDLGGSTP